MTRHFKFTVAYDGTRYGGWQRQPHVETVQQQIEVALEKVVGSRSVVLGSGRTDAGVHARAQVASCSVSTWLSTRVLKRALNANLPDDIRITRAQEVDSKFHARISATAKEYRYQIDCGKVADPFLRSYAWHHPWPLSVGAMRRAARLLKGRHNFSALSAKPMRPVENRVRTISRISVNKSGTLVTVAVCANGFLYKMVRSIVGALVKVGEGRMSREQLRELLDGKKRSALVETAPAKGLFLWQVSY